MSQTSEAAATAGAAAKPASPAAAAAHRWWILATAGIAQLMVILDATVVNIALPTAQRNLGFSNADRQWVITAYSLAFGSLLLLGGRIADRIGRKTTFLIGVTGFAAASAVAGAAGGFTMLIAARAAQGVFGAMLAPSALAILNMTFPAGKDRGRAFGIFGAIAGGGGAIGLLLGGVLTETLSWRWTLYVNVGFAALAFAGGTAFLRRAGRGSDTRLDIPGAALAVSGLFSVVYGFSNAQTYAWSSPLSWGFIAAGAVLLAVFAWWQAQAAHPLLPLRIVADRNRAASYLSVFIVTAGVFGVSLFLTYYLQQVLGYSPIRTGLAFLPMTATLILASTAATSVILPRTGPRPIMPAGMALAASAMFLLTLLGARSSYAAQVLPALIIMGLGFGLIFSTAINMATAGIGDQDAGVGSAAVNTMQQVGGSVGIALLNTVAARAAASYLTGKNAHDSAVLIQAQLHSYATAYRWAVVFFLAGLVVSALLYRSGPGRSSPAETIQTKVELVAPVAAGEHEERKVMAEPGTGRAAPLSAASENRRTIMTYSEPATRPHPPARGTRPSRRPVPAIAIAVAAAAVPAVIGDTAVSLIARQAGVSGSFTPIQPATYIALTVIGLIAGALGWYTITRVSTRPGQLLRRLVPAAIVVSFIPDIAVGVSKAVHATWGGVGALMVMHVIVAVAGVASYHRFLPGRR